jgi:diaminohydroxyphosphoribosylaminopyrimidine deaminase/5-amino-6-(5-phosphoribosylamino)uracil reductase
MQRALVLARRGMGSVRPNPPVGAVLVREAQVVGEGFHHRAGKAHAEVLALAEAGEKAKGATLYVTLEPCNHQGRTPPCVPALLEAGVTRVVFAARDPNPVSAGGAQALRDAGVEVEEGPGRRQAAHLLAGFTSLVERKRPRFHLKMAASLDGRIATDSGQSRWISSEAARAWVHRLRRESDGVLIGTRTAELDNPALTTRSVAGRSPDRFVLDARLRLKPTARVWQENGARRVAIAGPDAPPEARAALEEKGVEVWETPAAEDGRLDLRSLAERMGEEGYTNILVEGGGTLAGSLFEAQLVDVADVVLARHLILGGGGPGWAEGLRVPSVPRAVRVARSSIRPLGPDWRVTLVPEAAQWWDPETSHV